MREYWDKIPVTFVDGVQIDFWRVSEARLRPALPPAAGAPQRGGEPKHAQVRSATGDFVNPCTKAYRGGDVG